jgi:DNA-nicking Smr family endonuclease
MARKAHSGSGAAGMAKENDTKPGAGSEHAEFRAAMRDVRPLQSGAVRVAPAPRKPRHFIRKAAAAGIELHEMPLIDADSGADVSPEEVLSHRRPGVRDQVLRRLRRGLIPIEAQLDLHGVTQSVARALTVQFIDSARAGGLRCVRIIHGKGLRSGSRGAILKSALNGWLRRHPDVMAFASARPIDGGAGAAYVLLRA